jgi:RNA polymerase sigma-70 factor (ECF subfamily)
MSPTPVRPEPDETLVLALQSGDPAAAEMLVDAYSGPVYRLALRLTGSRSDAEEVAQDTLWTVLRKIDTFKGDSAFGSWLYRIGANAAYQKVRSRKAQAREIALEDVRPALEADGRHWAPMDDWSKRVDEQTIRKELRAVLDEAIAALPVDYRSAVVLHDIEGMSNLDIAGVLGVSLAAVKSRVHRSRLYLRQRLASWMASGS